MDGSDNLQVKVGGVNVSGATATLANASYGCGFSNPAFSGLWYLQHATAS
jgi:hypothetical protein